VLKSDVRTAVGEFLAIESGTVSYPDIAEQNIKDKLVVNVSSNVNRCINNAKGCVYHGMVEHLISIILLRSKTVVATVRESALRSLW
jgi:hypothetical protein